MSVRSAIENVFGNLVENIYEAAFVAREWPSALDILRHIAEERGGELAHTGVAFVRWITGASSPVPAHITLVQVADHSGITKQIARFHLRKVFGRTNTSRQAELVGLFLRSSALHTAKGDQQ